MLRKVSADQQRDVLEQEKAAKAVALITAVMEANRDHTIGYDGAETEAEQESPLLVNREIFSVAKTRGFHAGAKQLQG